MRINLPQQTAELEFKRQQNTTAILRVFNYYRVFLSFALLLLFIQVPGQEIVGKYAPEVFQPTILAYIGINILVSFLCLIIRSEVVGRREFVFGVLTIDVILLCVLMYSSGGVASGFGNFLIFPVAFAGVLAYGRYSMVVAAIAVILGFYTQSNVMIRVGELAPEPMFSVGMLGIALFSVNILFQYLAVQLRRKEAEVTTLNHLNAMRKLAEETKDKLDDSNARFALLLNSAGDGVLGLTIDGEIAFANPKAAELLGLPCESLAGSNIRQFALSVADDDGPTTSFQASGLLHRLQLAAKAAVSTNNWARGNGELFIADYSCEATVDAKGNPTGAVVIFQDASKRREVEERMNFLANFDSLTKLANRTCFNTELEKASARSCQSGETLAVLLLDLDHFKYINDHFGHDYGDEILREAAVRMRNCIRNSDTAARLGGDEFAIILRDFNAPDNIALVARNLVEQIAAPYEVKGKQLRISASIGIALNQADGNPGQLMKSADIAMYASKHDGRNTWRFFSADMQYEAESLQRIQVALQNAVQQNEFKLNYQPIVSLKDESLHHSEALIRWTPRDEDPISPDIFIPIAEETGKINAIGSWVLDHVFEQLESWHLHYKICPKVAINVSTRQLVTDQFRLHVQSNLARFSVPAEALEIELTETSVMSEPDVVLSELMALHNLGIRISLDDFGTGNSSLEYLRKLPIDQVKIDKCFIQGIGQSANDEEIIRVMIAIAKTMQLTVVAEGIETDEQFAFLHEAGCDYGQGYRFYKPMDSLSLAEVIKEHVRMPAQTNVTDIATRRISNLV